MEDGNSDTTKGILHGWGDFTRGWTAFKYITGNRYVAKVSETASSAVQVVDKTCKNIKPIFRIDRPHKGARFDHINVNPKYVGLKSDPHTWLPPGTANVSAKLTNGLKTVNSVIEPITVAMTIGEFVNACKDDYKEETHQHKTETGARLVASSAAGAFGAKAGAAIGTLIFPGIGTIAGSMVGAIGGSMTAGSAASGFVGDHYDDISEGAIALGNRTSQLAGQACASATSATISTYQSLRDWTKNKIH